MNKIFAFLLVCLFWILSPLIVVVLSIALALSIFWAASHVLYQYFVNELNQGKNNDY